MRRDAIVIKPYDPEWPASFVAQRNRVSPVLEGWINRGIEHMGSTAVPHLPAKPIIDMLAVVEDVDALPQVVELMQSIGWVYAPEPTDGPARELSFCFPSIEVRTHHLHVVEARSPEWRGWLAFRDYMRSHPAERAMYASLKRDLAAEHGDDPNERDAYPAGKSDFVREVTARALSS